MCGGRHTDIPATGRSASWPSPTPATLRYTATDHFNIVSMSKVVKLLEDLTADLKEEEKHKIFYQNAIEFYKLEVID